MPFVSAYQGVWQTWTATSVTTPTYSNLIWTNWANQTQTLSTMYTAEHAWVTWNGQLYQQPAPIYNNVYVRTPAQIAADDAAHEKRHVAMTRARSLLESVLSIEQREELKKHAHFHVCGSRGRRYRIKANGQSGNVELLDRNGRVQGRFCAHPAGYLPDADAWLAQMLALETDEDRFLRIANVHAGARPADLVAA